MRTSEIRTRWLDYFAANGHEIRPSVPLVSPEPSILFTVAGMVPFIPYLRLPSWPDAASCEDTGAAPGSGPTSSGGRGPGRESGTRLL